MFNPDLFRVMIVRLDKGKAELVDVPGRSQWCGGSGLAALLFSKYGLMDESALHPDQPLIFALGPLNGYFPLMSKTVCGFKSPYNNQYAESHAGGRSSLALRFAGLDALVFTGKARSPTAAIIGGNIMELKNVHYLWGADVFTTGKLMRKVAPGHSGHRCIMRIGSAGENLTGYACINVDTYRHFGRLGAGTAMGAKNLKAIVIHGDQDLPMPQDQGYGDLFAKVHDMVTETKMMQKYHNLGTPANVLPLNELKSLPWRNLQATQDPDAAKISGEEFAANLLMHNAACSGCPVGCIHVGMLRIQFSQDHRFNVRQVSYDHEPNFAAGPMLGVTDPTQVLAIIDAAEREGLDIISAGVALAWATEAMEKGLISEKEALTTFAFGEPEGYKTGMYHLGHASNDFYRALGMGTMAAAKEYGGEDFACVIGQEMAGYGTGETYFTAQTLGFRHSHLDTGAYSYDQKHDEKDVDKVADFLVADERERVLLTCLVSCLFGREVYKEELVAEALNSLGYPDLAGDMDGWSERVRSERWRLKIATGFDPMKTIIPKRFSEVVTWKGKVDPEHMEALRVCYAKEVARLGSAGQ